MPHRVLGLDDNVVYFCIVYFWILCIPPSLATIILDTDVGEPWITAIPEFEAKLDSLKTRVRVKAARDMAEVAEGIRIVVSSALPPNGRKTA